MDSKDPQRMQIGESPDSSGQHTGADARARRRIWSMKKRPSRRRRRIVIRIALTAGTGILVLAVAGGWLSFRANEINAELRAAEKLFPKFATGMMSQDITSASVTIEEVITHTRTARAAANDPIWRLASEVPIVGSNFSAVREIAIAADEVASTSAKPLLNVAESFNWELVSPDSGKFNIGPLEESSPTIVSAATTIELTYQRLKAIDTSKLIPQVSVPLTTVMTRLESARDGMNTAADVSKVLPSMMGADQPREYLVLVQNSAEVRASGGLPGVLVVIRVQDGQLELVSQASGSELGRFDPPLDVDAAQTEIYSTRIGSYISDVNLTPDFPTTAKVAQAMWEKRFGGKIDGVVAIDPLVLVQLLEVSGPLPVPAAESVAIGSGLPEALTSENVVQTLLSDVYLKLEANDSQDAYFAAASQEIFKSIASGRSAGPGLLKALSRSYEENRLRLWSDHQSDQKVLNTTSLGGSVLGANAGGTSFGVFFNDGTGAKMDYYVQRRVQLIEVCDSTGYAQYKVKVSLTNTAPLDAATSLPPAVTGEGRFGVPPGSVQTNVIVYGPSQALVDTATADRTSVSFGSHIHGDRPVGVVTTRLAPGQTSEVEMSFVKVSQHSKPEIVVTPTIQDMKEVLLPTHVDQCMTSR